MVDTAARPAFAPAGGQVHPRDSSPDRPCSVAALGTVVRDYVAKLGSPWIEGEVTEWNVRAVGTFARLRDIDGDAVISLTIWSRVRDRIPKDIKAGDRIVVCAKPEYRLKSGDLSYVVSSAKHVGLGDLLESLERLRSRLRAEGMLDPGRKRRLPFLPHTVGLITGKNTDAEKDVLRNAELRWPHVRFRVAHAVVQGDQCVPSVLAALRTLDEDPEVDVIVIARGGGDFQDLLGFSDERMLRAVAAASTPIVSAIGHEADRPLLDDVADLRASTPTDAAKRVVPDVAEQLALVRQARARLATRLSQRLQHEQVHLAQLRSRPALRAPESLIQDRAAWVDQALARGRASADRALTRGHAEIAQLRASLRALSPQHTLDRGYAIVQIGGQVVRDARQAPEGAEAIVTVARGSFAATSHGERGE
jgi:exodeoxyribonuclease VII large subunit